MATKNKSNRIAFNEVIRENRPFVVAPGKKTEARGFITDSRVDRDTIPDGWYIYEIMHTDSGNPYCLEEFVGVNFHSTFVTQTKIKMNKNGYKALTCGYSYE